MALLKYQFWKNVTSEKWNSDGLNTFTTYLSSLLGVIAEYNSNHAQKWRQICPKVFNPSEFHFSEVTFFQNWYFSMKTYYDILYSILLSRLLWLNIYRKHKMKRIAKLPTSYLKMGHRIFGSSPVIEIHYYLSLRKFQIVVEIDGVYQDNS